MRKLEVAVQLGKDLQYLVTFKGFGFFFFFILWFLLSFTFGALTTRHALAVGYLTIPWREATFIYRLLEWFEIERGLKITSFHPLPWAGKRSTLPGCSKPQCPTWHLE